MAGLAAVAARVPEAQAGAVAEKFLAAMKETTDFGQLQSLAPGPAAVAARLRRRRPWRGREVPRRNQGHDGSGESWALAPAGLAAVAARVPEAQAGAVAEKFLAAIKDTTDSGQLQTLQPEYRGDNRPVKP